MGDCCGNKKEKQQIGGRGIRQNQKEELGFKVVLLGETNVGKSSIARCFNGDHFNPGHDVTIGAAYWTFSIPITNNHHVRLHLWDTAGEERFRSMLRLYYNDANAALIVYDVTKPQTFQSIDYWMEQLEEKVQCENMIIYLVGNKIDLPSDQVKVTLAQVKEKYVNHSSLNIQVFETSAFIGTNVQELFQDLCQNLYQTNIQ